MLFPDFVQHYIKSYSYLLSPRSGSFAKMISGVLDLSYSVTLYLEFMVGCFRFIVFSLFLSHFVFLEYLISVSNAHLLHHLPLFSLFSFLFLFLCGESTFIFIITRPFSQFSIQPFTSFLQLNRYHWTLRLTFSSTEL